MIKIIDKKSDIIVYKDDWDSLYQKTKGATPFQKYGYIQATIDFVYGDGYSLYFLFIRDAQRKEIVAIFPFVKNKNQILEFFNQKHTDFCIPLINPEVDHFNLYKELADFILNDSTIRGLNLCNLTLDSSMISSLKFHFKLSIVQDINYYPLVPIKASSMDKIFIEGLITVPSKRRGNLKKSYTQISDRCEMKVMSKSDGFEYPEETLLDMANQMISQGIRAKEYFSEQMLSWWKILYENDMLSVAVLYEEHLPVACTLIFKDIEKNECITWIMLYLDSKWNMRSNLYIVNYIYQHGDGTLNLARGIYDYKVTNFHPDVRPLFCVKIAKTNWGHFKNIITTTIHYSKPIVKAWLKR